MSAPIPAASILALSLYLQNRMLPLSAVSFVVIDEADKLLGEASERQLAELNREVSHFVLWCSFQHCLFLFSQIRADQQMSFWTATWNEEVRQCLL